MGHKFETLETELIALLKEHGATLVGVGSLASLPASDSRGFPFGVSVAKAMTPSVVSTIFDGPTPEYALEYDRLNDELDTIVLAGEDYLRNKGFTAFAQTVARVEEDRSDTTTVLPHKTVATRAGLGWIGKDALLVTKEYGSALRLSSLLTDAPLHPNTPTDSSSCGICEICKKTCPANAITGTKWTVGMPRAHYYDAKRCKAEAISITTQNLSNGMILCGRCLLACPFTQRYIRKSLK